MSTDNDSSSSSLGFKQLDDTNYSIWVQRMTDALAKKKYWRFAQGTEEKPQLDASSPIQTPPQVDQPKPKRRRHLRKNSMSGRTTTAQQRPSSAPACPTLNSLT